MLFRRGSSGGEDRAPPLLGAILLTWFLFKVLPFLLVLGVALFLFVMAER